MRLHQNVYPEGPGGERFWSLSWIHRWTIFLLGNPQKRVCVLSFPLAREDAREDTPQFVENDGDPLATTIYPSAQRFIPVVVDVSSPRRYSLDGSCRSWIARLIMDYQTLSHWYGKVLKAALEHSTCRYFRTLVPYRNSTSSRSNFRYDAYPNVSCAALWGHRL